MVINVMNNPNFLLTPIVFGNTMIQCVTSYKLLGLFIDDDLKWTIHVDYTYKNACKKLYSLRLLRRAGVTSTGILKVYLSVIRPVLEYTVPVWKSISEVQSEKLESIKKRALKIIFPSTERYTEALSLARLETLAARRYYLCEKYMDKMRCTNHPLNILLPSKLINVVNMN